MRSLRAARSRRTALVTLLGVSLIAGVASYVPEAEAKPLNRPATGGQYGEVDAGQEPCAEAELGRTFPAALPQINLPQPSSGLQQAP